jgi:flagellar motility protein MotE (MotC chaperone)
MPSVENRKLLVKLAKNIYQSYLYTKETIQNLNEKQVEQQYLGLNIKQADKYNRLQFFFDPKRGYEEYYRPLFTSVFESGAEAAYQQLKAQHPLGIEIWVNPKDKTYHPLTENEGTLAADSLLSSAKKMLADLRNQQEEMINKYFKTESDRNKYLARLEIKYQRFLSSISSLHDVSIKNINNLYEGNIPTKESERKKFFAEQYRTVEEAVRSLQRNLVMQLSSFEVINPNKEHYKRNFKLLSDYEQQLKFRNFYPNEPAREDKEGDTFNRDIFALDVTEMSYDSGVIKDIKGQWHYHQRHYILTSQQNDLKSSLEDGKIIFNSAQQQEISTSRTQDNLLSNVRIIPVSPVNSFQPQATATSHSPDNLLPNFALIEEGEFEVQNTEFSATTNFLYSRHGSPTPDNLYPQQIMPRGNRKESHEATYRAFLNMEQLLLQLRIKAIENILITNNNNIHPESIARLSRIIGLEVTDLLHKKLLPQSKITLDEIIPQGIQNLLNQDFDNNVLASVSTALQDNAAAIVNVQHIHTHLITGTGVGSLLQAQRYMFADARLAQYATQDSNMGYIYMCNGVNRWRFEDIFMDRRQKLRGNNCVAFVELYKKISNPENSPFKRFELDFTNYDEELGPVRNAAKKYMEKLENNYIQNKIKHDKIAKDIELKKRQRTYLNAMQIDITLIDKELKSLTEGLSTLKNELRKEQKKLNELRNKFKDQESKLHKAARSLNDQIHEKMKEIDIKNVTGDGRGLYLASKAFWHIDRLFNDVEFGQYKWKLDKNNGLMQALVQMAAEQIGMSASGGCKSNNDRALLLALIISELSKVVNSKKELDDQCLDNVLKDAQEAYAWHISRTQSALDRSSPKTDPDILSYAHEILKQHASQYKDHQKFGKLAAHKRKGGHKIKKYNFENAKNLASDDPLYEYAIKFEQASDNLKGITEALTSFIIERGLSTQEKINALQGVKNAIDKWKSQSFIIRNLDYDHDKAVRQLSWDLEIRHYELRVRQKIGRSEPSAENIKDTTLYNNLKTFFDNLQQRLANKNQLGRGHGLEQISSVMEIYGKSTEKGLEDLLKLYLDLRTIAFSRHNDMTSTLARNGFSFFEEKRPVWLRELYKSLQLNINGGDFSFDRVLGLQPTQQPAGSEPGPQSQQQPQT